MITDSVEIVMIPYSIEIVSPRVVIVSGGRLETPVKVSNLLGDGDNNPKTAKNIVPTMGLSLAPHKMAGIGNMCAFAANCEVSCLAETGRGKMSTTRRARIAKTVVWMLARQWFVAKLNRELSAFRSKYTGEIGVRLNMLSDQSFESFGIVDLHPDITFYDYTKNPKRIGLIRPNYWVTYSWDGRPETWAIAQAALENGKNIAIVFYNLNGKCQKSAHKQSLPTSFRGIPVIDGGATDWRPEDTRGVIVGLRLLASRVADRQSAIDSGFAILAN